MYIPWRMNSITEMLFIIMGSAFSYILETFNIMVGNLNEIKLSEIMVSIATTCLMIKSKVDVKAKHMYNTYPIIRHYTDACVYVHDYCRACIMGYSIEPLCNNWISVSNITNNDMDIFLGDDYEYTEKYHYFTTDNETATDLYKRGLDRICDIASSKCIPNSLETLVTMKIGNKYMYSSFFHTDIDTPKTERLLPTTEGKNVFLSIEYTHPSMSKGIVIELPTNMYIANNHILSATFVRRYLEHQDQEYTFDNNYVIKLLDTTITMMKIKANQYINIKRMGYEVITIYPDDTLCNEPTEEVSEPEEEDTISNNSEAGSDISETADQREETSDTDRSVPPQIEQNIMSSFGTLSEDDETSDSNTDENLSEKDSNDNIIQ